MTTPGCYKITHKVSGKFYVGSSVDIHNRWKGHINDLNKQQHSNSHLQASWNKHGEDAFDFEILAICPEGMVRDVEQSYLDEIFSHPNPRSIAYNISKDSTAPMQGRNHTEESRHKMAKIRTGKTHAEETKRKQSESAKGENNPFYGKTHASETINKMSATQKSKPDLTCPWCGKTGGYYGMKRNHMNNCKHRS